MVSFGNADEFFETAAEGGTAFRFKDIDGIGPATADKLKAVRGVDAPTDVKDMSADELADKAGISRNRASKAISGAGGNPNVSKVDNSSSVSAAGIRSRKGDFWVEVGAMDRIRARNDPRSRSEEAIRQDDRKRAPITTDEEQWKSAPGKWDFPGVDTPTQDPKALPKDYKAGGEFDTTDVEDDEIAQSQSSGFDLVREIGGEQVYSEEVVDEGPKGAIPGVAPNDFEDDGFYSSEQESDVMGAEPSSQRLSADARDNLATGVQADMAMMSAEEERAEESERGRMEFDFPAWTVSRGQTYLNEKVYGEGRDDLDPLREKVSNTKPSEGTLELTKGEYNTFQRVVREEAQEEIERADRMEANIFGDTDEQAEIAREAMQGIINNPPKF